MFTLSCRWIWLVFLVMAAGLCFAIWWLQPRSVIEASPRKRHINIDKTIVPRNIEPGSAGLSESLVERTNQKVEENPDSLREIAVSLINTEHYKAENADNDVRILRQVMASELNQEIKNFYFRTYTASVGLNRERLSKIAMEFASDPKLDSKLLSSVLAQCTYGKPAEIYSIFQSLPWKSEYKADLSWVFMEWTSDAPTDASNLVRSLKGKSPMYEWAVVGLVQAINGTDPASAEVWKKELGADALQAAQSTTLIRREIY